MQHLGAAPPSEQDGLHNVLTSPEFEAVLYGAIEKKFAPLIDPELVELLRRFLSPSYRNDSRSYDVGVEPPAAGVTGRVKILERDPQRRRAFVWNAGAQTVFVGGRQVTVGGLNDPSGGIPIPINTGQWFELACGEMWAVSSAAHQDVRVLELMDGL